MARKQYSLDELFDAARADLLADAAQSEKQAEEGPYFPEKGITKENLIKWAKDNRDEAARMNSAKRERFKRASIANTLKFAGGFVDPFSV